MENEEEKLRLSLYELDIRLNEADGQINLLLSRKQSLLTSKDSFLKRISEIETETAKKV